MIHDLRTYFLVLVRFHFCVLVSQTCVAVLCTFRPFGKSSVLEYNVRRETGVEA
jgi:hypothetical protein